MPVDGLCNVLVSRCVCAKRTINDELCSEWDMQRNWERE